MKPIAECRTALTTIASRAAVWRFLEPQGSVCTRYAAVVVRYTFSPKPTWTQSPVHDENLAATLCLERTKLTALLSEAGAPQVGLHPNAGIDLPGGAMGVRILTLQVSPIGWGAQPLEDRLSRLGSLMTPGVKSLLSGSECAQYYHVSFVVLWPASKCSRWPPAPQL